MDYVKLYTETFAHADYNLGGSLSYAFLSDCVKKLKDIDSILDIGSGRGNVIITLADHFSMDKITSADLKKFHNQPCKFFELDLSNENLSLGKYDLITCLDVMEHLEEKLVDKVFKAIAESSKYQVMTIANHREMPYEKSLHLIIQKKDWWIPHLEKYFEILETKDIYDCLYGFLLKTKV